MKMSYAKLRNTSWTLPSPDTAFTSKDREMKQNESHDTMNSAISGTRLQFRGYHSHGSRHHRLNSATNSTDVHGFTKAYFHRLFYLISAFISNGEIN